MFLAAWISCLLQHTLHSLSLCSSHHSALDFINMLFDLASTQCKPKNSTELAVSPSTGRRVCMYVCGCVCGVFVGTFLGEWKNLVLLDQEALNHAGSSCKDPEGVRLSRLDSGRLSEPEPGLSLTPGWWWVQFLPHPHKAGHTFPLLTRLARCRRFPVLGSVFSFGSGCAVCW